MLGSGWLRKWGDENGTLALVYTGLLTLLVAVGVIALGVVEPYAKWWIVLTAIPTGTVSVVALLATAADGDPANAGAVAHGADWPKRMELVTWIGVIVTVVIALIGVSVSDGLEGFASYLAGLVAGVAPGALVFFLGYAKALGKLSRL